MIDCCDCFFDNSRNKDKIKNNNTIESKNNDDRKIRYNKKSDKLFRYPKYQDPNTHNFKNNTKVFFWKESMVKSNEIK